MSDWNIAALWAREESHNLRRCPFVDAIKTNPTHWQPLLVHVAHAMRRSPRWTQVSHYIGEKIRGGVWLSGRELPEDCDQITGEIEAK